MGKAVTAVQDDLFLISLAVSIGDLIPEFVLVRLGVDAIATIYGYIAEGTLSDYEDALTNAPLLSDLVCAIYDCIVVDGYVTPSNFSCILDGVGGITSAPSDVITAIKGYLTALGAVGLAQLSQIAGLESGADCSACGGFCRMWDFEADARGFGQTPDDAQGFWAATPCNVSDGAWFGSTVGAAYAVDITTSQFSAVALQSVEISGYTAGTNPGPAALQAIYNPDDPTHPYEFVATGGTFDVTVDIGGVAFAGGFRIAIWSTAPVCISWIKVTTSGSAPGGNALTGC
jgi:hypothetical protein